MTSPSNNSAQGDKRVKELTFEQQQKIDELAKKAYTPSSNSNKYRFELYAYINSLIDDEVRKARVEGKLDGQIEAFQETREDTFKVSSLAKLRVVTGLEISRLMEIKDRSTTTASLLNNKTDKEEV